MLRNKKFSKTKIHYTGLFSINAQCNDNCKFCIKSDFIKKGYLDLTFEEIKKNYFVIKNKYKIDHVVISGGEPTIHPQIFQILNFFKKENIRVHLVTNLLRIARDDNFFKKLKPYFNGSEANNKLFISVNDLSSFSKNAQLRMNGLIKILKFGLRAGVITLIYQDNIRDLSKLARLFRSLFQKYHCSENNGVFEVELRSIYISETPKQVVKEVLPQNFAQVKKGVEDFISILRTPTPIVNLLIWHFPLCYIKNYNQLNLDIIQKRYNSRYIWVDKIHQLKKIKVLGVRKQQRVCSKCVLRRICTGMCNKEYMDKYNFPVFKPIKKL